MATDRRRRRNLLLLGVLLPLAAVVLVGLLLAGSAGFLPGQPEPTRIPITPFADLRPTGEGTPAP